MDLLKRWKSMAFVDNGLMLGVVLITLCAFTWTRFVDWSGPVDEMDPAPRAALEDCVTAERSLGDSIDRERPDCRAVLQPSPLSATIPMPRSCERRANDKRGGDDGLDTCGYPGFPKCLDALPPGCP
ncbi:MAG TPA: hypothetical protein VJ694_02405 [Patescibacteria group bacterium]|nr:hypothetical protein [Patescibacteria group bacterium]